MPFLTHNYSRDLLRDHAPYLSKDKIISHIRDKVWASRRHVSFWSPGNHDKEVHKKFIGDEGTKHLTQYIIKNNSPIFSLNLCHSLISDDGAKTLAELLKSSSNYIDHLDLYENEIGDTGAIALAEALKHPNCKVNNIMLHGNEIGDKGAIALAEALKHPNCKVGTIKLGGNLFRLHGFSALSASLPYVDKRLCLGDGMSFQYNRSWTDQRRDCQDAYPSNDEIRSYEEEAKLPFSSQYDVTKAIDGAMGYWQEGYEKKITAIEATVESEQKELVDEWKKKKEAFKKIEHKYGEYKEQCNFHTDIPATLANIGGDYREKRDALIEIEKRMSRKGGRPNHVKVGIEAGRSIQRVLAAGSNIPATGHTHNDGQKQGAGIGKVVKGLLSFLPNLSAMGSEVAGDAAERMSIADRRHRILQAYEGGRKKFFSDGVSTIDEPVDNVGECPSEIPEEGSVTERIIQEGVMHPYEKFSNIIERISPEQIEKLEGEQLDKLLLSSFNSLNMQAAEGVDSPSAQKALLAFNTLLKKAPESMFHGQGALTGGRLENCLTLIKNVLRVNSDSENPQDQDMQLVKLCGDALGTIFDKADENTFNRNDPQTHVIRQTLKDITSFSITIASAANPTDVNATKPLEVLLGAIAKNVVHEFPARRRRPADAPILNSNQAKFAQDYGLPHLLRIVEETQKRTSRGDFGLLSSLISIAERADNSTSITKGNEVFLEKDEDFLEDALASSERSEVMPPAAIILARMIGLYKDTDLREGGLIDQELLEDINKIAVKFKDSGFLDHMGKGCAFRTAFIGNNGDFESMKCIFNAQNAGSLTSPSTPTPSIPQGWKTGALALLDAEMAETAKDTQSEIGSSPEPKQAPAPQPRQIRIGADNSNRPSSQALFRPSSPMRQMGV